MRELLEKHKGQSPHISITREVAYNNLHNTISRTDGELLAFDDHGIALKVRRSLGTFRRPETLTETLLLPWSSILSMSVNCCYENATGDDEESQNAQ